MKKILLAAAALVALNTASALAAPILYNVTGTLDASLADQNFTASLDFDGDVHTLTWDDGLSQLSGGPGASVSITPGSGTDVFDFAFQTVTNPSPLFGIGPDSSVFTLSQTPGTTFTTTGDSCFPAGSTYSFTGGGLNPNFTISLLAEAVAPELNAQAATLPFFSGMLLLGLTQGKRRQN